MPWVNDWIFVAGGDMVMEQWREFRLQLGLSAVITIGADAPGLFVEPPPWAWLWLPLADETAYTLDHLRLGVDFLRRAAQARRKALLHGGRGMHRARPLVGAYLLAEGQPLPGVLRALEQRPWLPPYKGDVALLETWSQQHPPG